MCLFFRKTNQSNGHLRRATRRQQRLPHLRPLALRPAALAQHHHPVPIAAAPASAVSVTVGVVAWGACGRVVASRCACQRPSRRGCSTGARTRRRTCRTARPSRRPAGPCGGGPQRLFGQERFFVAVDFGRLKVHVALARLAVS